MSKIEQNRLCRAGKIVAVPRWVRKKVSVRVSAAEKYMALAEVCRERAEFRLPRPDRDQLLGAAAEFERLAEEELRKEGATLRSLVRNTRRLPRTSSH